MLPWALKTPNLEAHHVAKFQLNDVVRLIEGTSETARGKGQPQRPRSAIVQGRDLADLKSKPKAQKVDTAEAIYLIHCCSTETT